MTTRWSRRYMKVMSSYTFIASVFIGPELMQWS